MDLEKVWRLREEEVYPGLFGGERRGIFTLDAELFAKTFNRTQVDPRWLFHGVFEFSPTASRPFWLYVTSGYSNPWDAEPNDYDREGESGYGVEFLFASSQQGDWAIRYLLTMLAYDTLLSVGHFPSGAPIAEYDHIPLRSPINGDELCELRNVIVSQPETLPSDFSLPSGRVLFLTFTGVTEGEIAFAKAQGTPELIEILKKVGHYPVTDPLRSSAI
jgi:hypothetical protein